MTTLFTSGSLLRLPSAAIADWLLVDGATIRDVGKGEPPPADKTIDLDGGWLLPAFCDGHVHLPATGLYVAGLDLRGEAGADAIVDAFRAHAEKAEGVLFGGNFEDPKDRPLTRRDLDTAVGDRPALLARADMHSCVVSTALLKEL
ncbi:MAG TPA: amidohydrolase family protein, partial [Actinomycetota bacterium]|nr:amidohydrolase family protein [Actinomycetota bacterium]